MIRPATRFAFVALSALLAASRGGLDERVGPDAARVRSAVRAWRRQNASRAVLREFVELLALPNVASDEPGHPTQRRAHRAACSRPAGSRRASSTGKAGRRVVYGESARAGAPRTVIVYAHYDGQPVEPERWTSPPWTPVLRDGPLARER